MQKKQKWMFFSEHIVVYTGLAYSPTRLLPTSSESSTATV